MVSYCIRINIIFEHEDELQYDLASRGKDEQISVSVGNGIMQRGSKEREYQ